MTRALRAGDSPRTRILMLSGQAFALGLTTALIMIPASAIFLEAYGSKLLPVTYIGAAVAGGVATTLLAATLRRRPIAAVAARVLAVLVVLLVAAWGILTAADADWVSFALLVLVPIVVPMGFIFVVGQAGLLLDVRVLKALYARVVAGFALGFLVGGLAGSPLLSVLDRTANLLAVAAAAAGLFLALVVETRRRYPVELAVVEHPEVAAEPPTLRALSSHRYVMLIVAFQMLSAVESQWLDFLVLGSAADRYHDSYELAQFVSRFSAIAYGTDILFLLLLAGWLLRRFGLRYGLTANSVGVLIVLGAIIAATSLVGSAATIVFVLIVAARVADLTFSDGAARTSLSAAYQAVPSRLRAVAQATVEGLAVPVAIGLSGVVLLLLQSAGGTDGLVLPTLTAIVVVVWVVVAVLVYREYRVNLLANLRGRTLDLTGLTLEDETSLLVIDRLVESDEERDVRLGLDILTIAQHPELSSRLGRLVEDRRVSVRTDALARLVDVAPQMAADAARIGIDDPAAAVRAASIRVLGAAREPADVRSIAAHANDPATEVKVAVAVALSRVGDDAVRGEVATTITGLAQSGVATDRQIAALMLGEVEPGAWIDRSVLHPLLADPNADVANAALAALRWPHDRVLIGDVATYLDRRVTATAAMDAIVRAGDAALDVVDAGLRDGHGRHAQELLVRAAREIGGPPAIATLSRHLEHRDREIGLAVMNTLAALGPADPHSHTEASDPGPDEPDPTERLVREDLEHATHVVRALVTFADEPAATLLVSALHDEFDLLRARVLAAFSMRHGTDGINRVVYQLGRPDSRSHALALEWLDVSLTGTDRAVIALLEPGWSERDRLQALLRTFPIPTRGQREIHLDLIEDPAGRWRRPWITACALHSAWPMSDLEFDAIATTLARRSGTASPDGEESIVTETLAGIRHRRLARA